MTSKSEQIGEGTAFRRAGVARSTRRNLIDNVTGDGVPTSLPLDQVCANPDNPRDGLTDLDSLAASLTHTGQVAAITVASVDAYLRDRPTREPEIPAGATHVVVDGNRRLAAARIAGLPQIKVFVDDALATTDKALLEASFVANCQREAMTDLEEAQALKNLVEFHGSQHETARRIGRSQGYISQRLSLLELTPELQADLEGGRRLLRHVRGLAKVAPEEQRRVADQRAEAERLERAQRKPRIPAPAEAGDYPVISGGASPAALKPTAPAASATASTPGETATDYPVITPDGSALVFESIRNALVQGVDLQALARALRSHMKRDARLALAEMLIDD
ncbi:ParB/RepB/Spo0J family partition protein (plasmid) [Streptomyces sp. NBC_01426]|uniref:ParB/RepB/Spo0J family partition protein n=1 Tax=Streptomyces sp. NBC_01426 TaxID=2975866 RepID=UPI002E343C4C|nr:ParB/RepB/Spo0J family partition protein [Streptomyces sp. NBC_01426]